jgi:ribosomal protein L16 Arg81 hydroxylase
MSKPHPERAPMIATLADLLAPISTSEFLEAFRASRRLHVRTFNPTRMASLLPWHDIDALLDVLARANKLSILRDGQAVPQQFYTSGEDGRFNSRAFHHLAANGVSVVVNTIDESIPRIGHLAAAIERELGIQTWVNAYLSFSKGGALGPHRDRHDVLVAQIYGHKQWRVWNADMAYPVGKMVLSNVNDSLPPDQVVELAPGDVLFIPRGEPHAATVSSELSVHLTIGLSHMTGLNIIDHLRNEARSNTLLRMNLPRHSSEEEMIAHEITVKQALFQLIDAIDIAQFLRTDDLRRPPYLHTAVTNALPQVDDILVLTLRRRIPLPDAAPGGAPQSVTIGGESYPLAPASIGVMRWLFDHGPAVRRALDDAMRPQYTQAEVEAALREMLRFGFLAVNVAH